MMARGAVSRTSVGRAARSLMPICDTDTGTGHRRRAAARPARGAARYLAPMNEPVALLLTDLVDSAALAEQLGDTAMAAFWAAHDRQARDLLRRWRGREIDKSDGFLLVFGQAADALGYALAYHRALAGIEAQLRQDRAAAPAAPAAAGSLCLRARAGLHVGPLVLRENPAADVALGAKPFEADGLAKPVAARVMATALGGQTLLTAAACSALGGRPDNALGSVPQRVVSHGHWRLKGLPEPLELFEAGEAGAPFTPPPDAEKAYRVIAQGNLWLPARSLPRSLPAERDAFVGRAATLQVLARRFEAGARLVSLLGIGGGGKTRLAVRYGWLWLGDYPGGVWFCDLAQARSSEGLVSAVAQGLQVPLGQQDAVSHLGQVIAGRGACLVILDNFEQIARHAESTLGRWLDSAGQARFLVTSREVLGIAGEEALVLEPMPAPDAEELFLRRAAAVSRETSLAADERAAVAPLVRLLDGLPLAIELAAARARTLTPRALLARMSERFKLLASSGYRLDRQATLRAAFDWSWDLLAPAEKATLAQLSVFEGGFTLEAAAAVVDLAGLPGVPPAADLVHALVDKSFVRALAGERFDLLVSVQDYAAEHLQTEGRYAGSGPAARAAAQARHGAWFAAFGPRRAADHACADLDNLSAACRRAVARGDAEAAAGALEGAWAALFLRGPFKAGVELAEPVCALPGLQGRAAARAHAALGGALEASGQRAPAEHHYELALGHARAAADRQGEADVTVCLGTLHWRTGQPDRARTEHAHALQLARDSGNGSTECAALNGLGTVDFEQGLMDGARVHWEAALDLARRIGDFRWQGSLLGNLGSLCGNLGQVEQAATFCDEALGITRQLGDRMREGNQLSNLAMLLCLQGRLDAAAAAAEAALAVGRALAHALLECTALGNLALVHEQAGRPGPAQMHFEAALGLARQLGNQRVEGQYLGHLGLVQARQGRHDEAQECLARGEALLRAAGDGLSLAMLLCQAAECHWLVGKAEAASSARAESQALASQAGAAPQSELGSALVRLATLLGTDSP
jgi:predicted ATPase/class 3 adenylate cyclase